MPFKNFELYSHKARRSLRCGYGSRKIKRSCSIQVQCLHHCRNSALLGQAGLNCRFPLLYKRLIGTSAVMEFTDFSKFGAEDYCRSTDIIRSPKSLLYARSHIVNCGNIHWFYGCQKSIAKAFNLSAIDMVCLEFRDQKKLRDECEDGKIMGFDGKVSTIKWEINLCSKLFILLRLNARMKPFLRPDKVKTTRRRTNFL